MPQRVAPMAVLFFVLAAIAQVGCDDDAAARVTLRLANWSNPAAESAFMHLERDLFREFESEHPGVRVQVDQIPGQGNFAPKVLMMSLAASPPDVIQLDASSAAVFINNDLLLDLKPFIDADPDFRLDDYFENVVSITRRGDAIYAIPLDFTPMVMFYNRRLLEAANVAPPTASWTWDDFAVKCEQLTRWQPGAAIADQYGFWFENHVSLWAPWLWTNDGDILTHDGKHATGALDEPQSAAAISFLLDLIQVRHLAPSLREASIAGADLFEQGRAAFDLKGHWKLIDYRARGLDVGVAPLPTRDGKRTTVVYASGMSIMRGARNPELAWQLIKHFTSDDVQVRRISSGVAISGNRAAAAYYARDPIEQAFMEEVAFARPPWGAHVERYPFIEELMNEMMRDLIHASDKADVPAALRRTAAAIDAALEE